MCKMVATVEEVEDGAGGKEEKERASEPAGRRAEGARAGASDVL